MKSKLIGSFFVVLTLVVGIIAFAPSAFADTAEVTMTKGSSAGQACVTANNCFDPPNVQVAPGTEVEWKNADTASHTVTSGKPSDNTTGTVFDSGLVKAGGDFKFTFTDAGTFDYYCQVHPWMTGVVTVAQGVAQQQNGVPLGGPYTAPGTTTTNNNTVPEFGPIASLVLVVAIVSVVAVTAKTRGFLKL